MFPAFPKPTVAQGYQRSYSQHERISVRLLGGLVEEGTDAGIVIVVDEVTSIRSARCGSDGIERVYMRSSWTLCRPEGSDLYSTLSLSSTTVA